MSFCAEVIGKHVTWNFPPIIRAAIEQLFLVFAGKKLFKTIFE